MAAVSPELLAHREWLGQIQQLGLVVAPQVLVNNGVHVNRQDAVQPPSQWPKSGLTQAR